MSEPKWRSIDEIRRHGADWCVSYQCVMDDIPLDKLAGVVKRINAIIEAAFKAGAEQK